MHQPLSADSFADSNGDNDNQNIGGDCRHNCIKQIIARNP